MTATVTPQSILDWVPILLSVAAFLISIASFWKSYLSPFHVEISNSTPTFSLYKITPKISGNKEGRTWWIPSFDIGFSFHNAGQKPGTVRDIRLKCEFKSESPHREFLFYGDRVVDYSEFEKVRTQRMEWTSTAVLREWYPLILGPKETQHLHLILEMPYRRWDKKIVARFAISLEVLTSANDKWLKLHTYDFSIEDSYYQKESSCTLWDPEFEASRKES